ncbi:MAG: sigma-70 family RNA polymerase sigma factor [Chitinophagaceae bacterium]|nr:sigma-70 family RNA polymerase sigma factor [Chitinophagaceae bacterium]
MTELFTDKALLAAADEGAAFRILYERYWEILYKKALARVGNDADAQDVVQQAFISCWRNKGHIEIKDSLAPYLYAAIKYAIIKLVYRQAKKGVLLPLNAEELEHTELTTEELLAYKELQTVIANEVSELPERMQEIYRLSRMEHLQVTEIAARLNISEQTVKNTLHTALKRLREKLGKYNSLLLFLL